MTRVAIGLFAVLSIFIVGVQADEAFSEGTPPTGDSDPVGGKIDNPSGLAGILQLNEGQRMRLQSLSHEFEDEVFPLILRSGEKEWELRRLGRSQDSDASRGKMLIQEVDMLHEQIEAAGDRHRQRARALLSSQQISVLGKIEEAVELAQVAKEAACANLIVAPDFGGPESGWGPTGFAGYDSCGTELGIPAVFGGHVVVDGETDAVSIDRANP